MPWGGRGASGSVVGQSADVACAELAVDHGKGEADAIAVGQRRGWVDLKFGQRDAGCFEQPAKLSGFRSELGRVCHVLELAAAAAAEVRTGGGGAVVSLQVGGIACGEHRSSLLFVWHVEEAEARQRVGFEQALLEELLLHLPDLDGLHPPAIGGKLARGLFAQRNKLGLWCRGEKRGKELLFEDGEGAVEVFEVQGSRFEVRGRFFQDGEFAKALGGFIGGGAGGRREIGGGLR